MAHMARGTPFGVNTLEAVVTNPFDAIEIDVQLTTVRVIMWRAALDEIDTSRSGGMNCVFLQRVRAWNLFRAARDEITNELGIHFSQPPLAYSPSDVHFLLDEAESNARIGREHERNWRGLLTAKDLMIATCQLDADASGDTSIYTDLQECTECISQYAACPLVEYAREYVREAIHDAFEHMLWTCVSARIKRAFEYAKSDDERSFYEEDILTENLRTRGVCKRDATGWLYPASEADVLSYT